MAISIDVKELKSILDSTPAEQNVMLVGRHGIGKSKIIDQYYTKRGLRVVALFLGQMSDPGDLLGLPRLNETTGRTEFMPPYWFPTDGEPIVLFLDELNRARPEMLQTVMDLVLNRKLAGRELPAGSRIVSAVNSGEEYQVGDLDPALVSRFNIYQLKPSTADWLAWAKEANLDERVIKYITQKPSMLDSKFDANADSLEPSPDRRAWERVARAISGVKDLSATVTKQIAGIVGVSAAVDFAETMRLKGLTGLDILEAFDQHRGELDALSLSELTTVIDDLLDTMQNMTRKKRKFTRETADNLEAFTDWMLESERRESYVYFLNGFLNGKRNTATAHIAKNKPALLIKYNEFIANL